MPLIITLTAGGLFTKIEVIRMAQTKMTTSQMRMVIRPITRTTKSAAKATMPWMKIARMTTKISATRKTPQR